jgi:hypothetical protein
MAVLSLSMGLAMVVGASAQADHYPLSLGVAICETSPPQAGVLDPHLCQTVQNVTLEVLSGPSGDANSLSLGTCVTAAAGPLQEATCEVSVPFDTPLYVYYANGAASPAGYVPVPGGYPLFVAMTPTGVEPYPGPFYIVSVPAPQSELAATPATKQAASELSISVEFFICAPGVTAATAPAGCAPAATPFSVEVRSLEGVTIPADLAVATPTGDAYVFDDATLRGRGLFGRLAFHVSDLPPGYSDYLVTGDAISCDAALGDVVLLLPRDGPPAALKVYAIAPPEATPVMTAELSSVSTPASDESTPVGESETATDGETVCAGTFGD